MIAAVPAVAGEPAVTRGPYLQALLGTSAEVLWRTDVDSAGALVWTDPEGIVREVREDSPRTAHRIRLEGLAPGRRYRYRILDGERELGEEHSFRTSPPRGDEPIRIAVIGDSGTGGEVQAGIAGVVRSMAPDIFLHTGDVNYIDDVDAAVFAPYREVFPDTCFYPSRGNHDVDTDWEDAFVPPSTNPEGAPTYYSFDWGNGHFVALDTNLSMKGDGPQIRWLRTDLTAAREAGAPWIVLYFHHMLYTVGYYRDERRRPVEIPLLAQRHGVDLVLCGHEHNYQVTHPVRRDVVVDAWQYPAYRSPRGTVWLTTGGGGYSLYEREGGPDEPYVRTFVKAFHAVQIDMTRDELKVRAIGADGTPFDEFRIVKDVPRPELRIIRGDIDSSGTLNITDALALLGYLFLGGALPCPAAADLTGGGEPPDIAAAVTILNYLFLGGPPPPAPFPGCGPVAESEDAWCLATGCPAG